MSVARCWDGIRKHHRFFLFFTLNLMSLNKTRHVLRIVLSWLQQRNNADNSNDILLLLFDRYIPPLLEANEKFLKIVQISDNALVQMTCNLLNCLLTEENVPANSPSEWYEIYFMFAAIWGFGSSLFADQHIDWRLEFSKFWVFEFRHIPFPENACVFDYYVDKATKEMKLWSELVPKFELDVDIPLQVS